MSKTETNELEWYFRDLLFRIHNKGILQLEVKNIPFNIIETYLRYRNEESGHITSVLKIVLENLVSSRLLELRDDFVGIRDGISRLQCDKCYYICYLGNLEAKSCLRCQSNELSTFPKKKLTMISSWR
ncbi:MAG TPA: hypothetical protein VFM20_04840 [Nitrososphaeraceae archaeon]|nr:hypothetical protein [Nitrososphaeraceae archaeon]